MNKPRLPSPPHDQKERLRALDPERSVLVQAPAGSGKTDLLTRRFLRLLSEVEEPGQVVAITFTIAAAAEMRHRILDELEKAAGADPETGEPGKSQRGADEFSMESLAHQALKHSRAHGWNLLDLPGQLRISTIDSFCRELALQQPLLSGFGGGLAIFEQPRELYRRAARETLRKIDQTGSALGAAIEELLLWRDNGWQEMEELLVEMLSQRDRWMHGFLLEREPDWSALRERLERPFAKAVDDALTQLSRHLDQAPGAREEALRLARFACARSDGQLHRELAERAEFPAAPFTSIADAEEARQFYLCLAALLLTNDGDFRKAVDKRLGFPAEYKKEKQQILALIAALAAVPGLEAALSALRDLPPARYEEEDWKIVRACFTLLRQAAGELQIAFAEAGAVDFTEVAQIAQRVLRGSDGLPTDAALVVSERIRHLLVDEFQDTSRRQHQLLASLVAAWPEPNGRSCFAVGDPMQSVYFFRDADAALFPRVRELGLEIPHEEPLQFDFVALASNFRTAPALVNRLNQDFERIFAIDDGSGVAFSSAQPAREETSDEIFPFSLHLKFVPQPGRSASAQPEVARERSAARATAKAAQIEEIVRLIRSRMDRMEEARKKKKKFRIAILGRAKNHLAPIAQALREAGIPCRAVELETLADRTEVLDALALARALLNPQDRVAWLGVLRAPWCGLSLDDLHRLTGDREALTRPVPDLLRERLTRLSAESQSAASRLLDALSAATALGAMQPTATLGTWLEQVWLRLGGAACVDRTARANLSLLWSCLDRLPGGAADLLGPGLDAALERLTALPDPEADSDCGVQLMTIHKAKGLEFEVVIVAELQATTGRSRVKLLSWLERGLERRLERELEDEPAHADDSAEITEFLVAPLQPKGADRGKAKEWVDRVCRERESQEARRILYVAATRAREELHLFARPAYKEEEGSFALASPANSLLATAWPALEEEVHARFAEWTAAVAGEQSYKEQQIQSIAAVGEDNLLVMPAPIQPTLLRRLPTNYQTALPTAPLDSADEESRRPRNSFAAGSEKGALYIRHEGGLLSRALGTAVHALLEELTRLRVHLDWPAARAALPHFVPPIEAGVRATGASPAQAARIAVEALDLALSASIDSVGAWILSPHPNASSEVGWVGVVSGQVRSVRPDRVFQAGAVPDAEGPSAKIEDCWWIIDYKTAHADSPDLLRTQRELRALFAPQLEAYGQILRSQRGQETLLRAGLYYPRTLLLDWWEL